MNTETTIKSETVKTYPPEEMDAIGKRLAQALKLRRDTEHRDRWQTEWGTKTNTGLYLTLREMLKRIESGETDQI